MFASENQVGVEVEAELITLGQLQGTRGGSLKEIRTQHRRFLRPWTKEFRILTKITPRVTSGVWGLELVTPGIQMTQVTPGIGGRLLGNPEETILEPAIQDRGPVTLMEAWEAKTRNLGPITQETLTGDLQEVFLTEVEAQGTLSGDLMVAEVTGTHSGDPLEEEVQAILSGVRETLTGDPQEARDPQEVQDTHLGVVDLEVAVSLLTVADLKGVIVPLPSDQIIGKTINTWAMEEFSMPVLKILMASIAMNLPKESSGCQPCSLSRGTPS